MALMEFSVNPLGTQTPSVSQFVARAVQAVQEEEGVKYTVTPMGTIVEGDLGSLLALIPKVHEAVFSAGAMRIVTVMKIDDRRDKPATMSGKMGSLRRELRQGR